MKHTVIVRMACLEDAPEILEIYRPYVEKTAITFEYEVPDLEEFRQRMTNILREHPYLVAEEDGEIIGYAYTGNLQLVGRDNDLHKRGPEKERCRKKAVSGIGRCFQT